MKKMIILFIGCLLLLGCGNNVKENNNQIDISSNEYFNLIRNTFTEVTKNNEYFFFDGYTTHYPYIQVNIKPLKKISKTVMEDQAQYIINEVRNELKKYDYKSGGILKYNYEYINIYFYDYNKTGELDRNEGQFIQFEILKI